MSVVLPGERLGELIAGKFRIDSIIGEGGMGVVFSARNEWTGREVAIKLLHGELNDREDLINRFFTEARSASSLDHPNVVEVLDMGQAEDGSYFMVLELLKGEPLLKLMRRNKVLDLKTTFDVLLPVMDALQRAHELNIVHRDIKPDNIFLHHPREGGMVPKLLDFGVAKVERDAAVTMIGDVFGTAYYMSPEQAAGMSDLDGAADVWSIAIIAYECLTSTLPYDGVNAQMIISKILTEPPPSIRQALPHLPIYIGEAIDDALEREPEDRPTMGELAKRLRNPEGRMSMPILYTSDDSASIDSELPTRVHDRAELPKSLAVPTKKERPSVRKRPQPQRALTPLGTPQAEPAAPPPMRMSSPEHIPAGPPTEEQESSLTGKLALVFLILILCAVAGAFYWMTENPPSDTNQVEIVPGGIEPPAP